MNGIKRFLKFIFFDETLKEDIDFLRQIAVFSHLSDRALAKIALIVFKKNYVSGEKIYQEKQEANVLYIIKSGKVLIKNSKTEKIVEEKDFFGEVSLLGNRRHDAVATALKDCELYLIYRVKFDDMVDSNAKVGLRIMRNLSSIFEIRLKCSENAQPEPEKKQDNNDDRNVK